MALSIKCNYTFALQFSPQIYLHYATHAIQPNIDNHGYDIQIRHCKPYLLLLILMSAFTC